MTRDTTGEAILVVTTEEQMAPTDLTGHLDPAMVEAAARAMVATFQAEVSARTGEATQPFDDADADDQVLFREMAAAAIAAAIPPGAVVSSPEREAAIERLINEAAFINREAVNWEMVAIIRGGDR